METLIIYLDSKDSKAKLREALKMFRGVTAVSDKLNISDVEELTDDELIRKMKKPDKTPLLTFEEGKVEFERVKS